MASNVLQVQGLESVSPHTLSSLPSFFTGVVILNLGPARLPSLTSGFVITYLTQVASTDQLESLSSL